MTGWRPSRGRKSVACHGAVHRVQGFAGARAASSADAPGGPPEPAVEPLLNEPSRRLGSAICLGFSLGPRLHHIVRASPRWAVGGPLAAGRVGIRPSEQVIVAWPAWFGACWCEQELEAAQGGASCRVQQAKGADSVEAFGQHVLQEAS